MWTDTAAKYQGPECAAAHSEWAKSLWIPPEHYSVGSESSPVLSCTQTQATAVRQVSLERGQFNPFKAFLSAELAGCTSSGNSSFFFFFLRSIEQNITIGAHLLYNIVLASATHQHESAIGIHMSPPSWTLLLPSPIPSHPSRLSQSTGLSSLCHIENSHSLSILHMVMSMFPCYSLNLSHSLLPPLCPQVCSLYLRLHCCPANRFISTIFLDSIHIH